LSTLVPALAAVLAAAAVLLFFAVRRYLASRPVAPAQTPARAWGLATSALITEVNGARHDILGAGFRAEDAAATLASAWDSTDRAGVRKALIWLESEGDRRRWESLRRAFEEGDPELEDRAFADPALRDQLEIIHRVGQRHPSLVAWDLCRAVAAVRFAFAAGFLVEAESWHWIDRFSAVIRSSFNSWREMSENYIVGREFAQGPADPDLEAAQHRLLDPANQASPWNRIRWR
jgi:Protein of unknown function (DUF1266)